MLYVLSLPGDGSFLTPFCQREGVREVMLLGNSVPHMFPCFGSLVT